MEKNNGKNKIYVGYQGVEGAYSHLAIEEYFKDENIEEFNYSIFEDVLEAVSKGEIEYGILPIENSSTGGITEVYDLIRQYNCFIIGEKIIKVDHNLLAYPGTKLEDIREVYSHPQGFAQCRGFFKEHPKMKQIPYYNTARGAKLVSEEKKNYMGAVAGKQAAKRYNLEILASNINANKNNYTRFFIISKKMIKNEKANKITMVVTLKHEPGSLYKLLGCFSNYNMNMENIESRPIAEEPWQYFFHIDVTGNLEEENVREALEKMKEFVSEYKVLGNYIGEKK
ncbi:MAG: prephenate dehydratase [Fusobacterium sp. JB021]|nr:prephenate dehydratase [Fusobacterium sp. JB021]MDP0505740.1 prephenate dehydratase [Fusobacterium sp. JB019]